MRIRAAVAALLILTLAAASSGAESPVAREIDRYLKAREALGQFNGTVLVVNRTGVVLRKSYGFANLELAVPGTPKTSYEIASLSKAFTAAAVLLLRDDGKLTLDDSICRFTEDCPEAWRPVTIGELLRHTGGIPDYESALEMGSPAYADAMARTDAARRLVDAARSKPLDFAPGSKFNYSNTGYLLLGFAIEKASGMSYRDFLQRRILTQLGLDSTGVIDRERIQKNRADGYTGAPDTPPQQIYAGFSFADGPLRRAIYTRLASPEGDASMYSTVDDLYTWVTALATGKLLSPDSLHAMFTPGPGNYGMGWFITKRFGRDLVMHTGNLPGFLCEIDRYAGGDLTVIALSNYDSGRFGKAVKDIGAIALHEPYDLPRSHTIVSIDRSAFDGFTGEYQTTDGRTLVISQGKKMLEAQMKGEYTAGLLPESATQFYMPFAEGTFRFGDVKDGKAGTVTMHYNGKDLVAKRVQ